MNVGELRALERLEADAAYLARLLERTMVEDALLIAQINGDSGMLNEVRQMQAGLYSVRECAKRAQQARFEHGETP